MTTNACRTASSDKCQVRRGVCIDADITARHRAATSGPPSRPMRRRARAAMVSARPPVDAPATDLEECADECIVSFLY
jgi:hypothetical protein